MGVYHRRPYVAVAEQFLDGADIIAILQKVRGEGVAESVTGGAFGDGGAVGGLPHRALHCALVQMVA
jgi:hypothetical protein